MPETKRLLKVFLCHARADSDSVRGLYLRLARDGVDAWLDKEKLIGGQDWEYEIRRAVRESDVVVVCLSRQFAQKGFRQYEVRIALEEANLQPEGEIFIIPLRLEDCNVPQSLRRWHWVDLFEEDGYERLMRALRARANRIGATLQLKRSWLPRITSPRSAQQKLVEFKKREKPKKKGETATDDGLPQIDEPLPPPDKFPSGWESEWHPSFESETTKKEEEIFFSAKSDLTPLTIDEKDEASEKAARQKLEHEAAEKAARDKARREATEKAKRERAERRAAQIATLKEILTKFFYSLRLAVPKAKPFLRIGGTIGVILVLFWVGSLAMPQLLSLIPTAQASATPSHSATIVSSNSPAPITKTVEPDTTSTITRVHDFTATPVVFDPHPDSSDYHDVLGIPMRLVPAGEFMMGNDAGADNERPAHSVYLDAYYIDKYEVTNKLYTACVSAGACQEWYVDFDNLSNPDWDNLPMRSLSWDYANSYCEWRGARLPSEAEWEKAARVAVGQTLDCDYANIGGCGGGPKPIGSYEKGKSIYGVYDLIGNVSEWVADYYSSSYYSVSPEINPPGPSTGEFEVYATTTDYYRVVRGGSWYSSPSFSSVTKRVRKFDYIGSLDTGFRCVRDVPP